MVAEFQARGQRPAAPTNEEATTETEHNTAVHSNKHTLQSHHTRSQQLELVGHFLGELLEHLHGSVRVRQFDAGPGGGFLLGVGLHFQGQVHHSTHSVLAETWESGAQDMMGTQG